MGKTRKVGYWRSLEGHVKVRRKGSRYIWQTQDNQLYGVWFMMKKRCFDPRSRYYPDYGGRGITVCREWVDSFDAFAMHVGPRPFPKASIDRIDNDGDYEPGNVRWATSVQQQQNKTRKIAGLLSSLAWG